MAILYSRSIHTQPSLGRVLLLVLLYPLLCLSTRITDVFTIAPETTNGGCSNYIDANGDGTLTDIWTDSVALNANAVRLMNAAISDDPARAPETRQARRLVATFFGTRRDYNQILAWYNDVDTALGGNAAGNSYFLFCDGDYEVKKKSSDQAQDAKGGLLTDQVTGNKITIAQGFPDLDFRSFAPYWIQSARIYVVDKRGHNPATYCNLQGSLGLTQHGNSNRAVLLCPNSFTTGPGKAQHVRLGAHVTDLNQDIQDFSCIAMTFYHELFHAVHHVGQAKDTTGCKYFHPNLAQAAQLTIYSDGARQIIDDAEAALDRELNGNNNANRQTIQAPENYTWFALAAWYFYQQGILFDAGQSEYVQPNL